MYYEYINEVRITYDYTLKELKDIEKLYDAKVIMNKALESVINKLIED